MTAPSQHPVLLASAPVAEAERPRSRRRQAPGLQSFGAVCLVINPFTYSLLLVIDQL